MLSLRDKALASLAFYGFAIFHSLRSFQRLRFAQARLLRFASLTSGSFVKTGAKRSFAAGRSPAYSPPPHPPRSSGSKLPSLLVVFGAAPAELLRKAELCAGFCPHNPGGIGLLRSLLPSEELLLRRSSYAASRHAPLAARFLREQAPGGCIVQFERSFASQRGFAPQVN